MTRIFPTLASLSLMLFVGAVVMGLSIGDLYDNPSESTLAWRGRHMLLGTAAALGEAGWSRVAVAEEPTLKGLADAAMAAAGLMEPTENQID